MQSRERVYAALEFKSPDRAPRDLWALPWVGMFAIDQYHALTAEFPSDFCAGGAYLGKGDRARGEFGRRGSYTDDWGCVWTVAEDGVAGEVKTPLLPEGADVAAYRPPWDVLERADFGAIDRVQAANLKSDNPRFQIVGSSVRLFERLQFLRGTETLLMEMADDSAGFRGLMAMVHEFNLRELEGLVQTACDAIGFADDWGSQTSLLIAPDMWRSYFKPRYREYCDLIRGAGKKVFFHSDGHISSLYPDLIELGITAVNSQLFCMDIEELARRYKGRITFWGELDRQFILPFGTVEDVYRAVGRVRRALDDGRGGAIAHCEWGKANPAANIRAMYEAWLRPVDELP